MTPIYYSRLTINEKKFLCNGAGRKGLQGYLVPDFVFTEAANRHDFDYWKGGSERDKMSADRRFLDNMLDAAEYKENGKKRFFIIRWFYRRMAFEYYTAVMEVGGNPLLGGFHYSDKKRTKEDLITQMEESKNGGKSTDNGGE